jgi:quinol monooxygenase YgiN
MRIWSAILLALATLPVIPMNAEAQDGPVYAVSYIDAAPASRNAVAKALQQLAAASRKDGGSERLEILQRIAHPNQFVMVSIWKDKKSHDAHAAAAHTKDFREKMKPQLISLVDDRLHSGFEIASGPAGKVAAGAIFVVTHVDVPPPRKDDCIALLNPLAADSRKGAGNLRFEVVQQTSRPNHFSVVEVWKDRSAFEARSTAGPQKTFRDKLGPMLGALYDERIYKVLN